MKKTMIEKIKQLLTAFLDIINTIILSDDIEPIPLNSDKLVPEVFIDEGFLTDWSGYWTEPLNIPSKGDGL